jgi:YbgC/YbaW family acyl-CoA thioester hydrolase
MPFEYRYQRRVEFSETDMAGLVHFSNFFRYMETAEHEFFRSLGLSVHADTDGRLISWPRVHAECSYAAPLSFGDLVEVHLLVRHKKRKSITYEFHFYKAGVDQPVARGAITVVCVAIAVPTGKMSPIAIPDWIERQIEVAPADRLHCGSTRLVGAERKDTAESGCARLETNS